MLKKKMYGTGDIIKMFDIKPITVYKRFASKYAKERWGVEEITLPDGRVKRFVPKDKVYLWAEEPEYRGNPETRGVV